MRTAFVVGACALLLGVAACGNQSSVVSRTPTNVLTVNNNSRHIDVDECPAFRAAVLADGVVPTVWLGCPQVLHGPACVREDKAITILQANLITNEALSTYNSKDQYDGLVDCGPLEGYFFVVRIVAVHEICGVPFGVIEAYHYLDDPTGTGGEPFFYFILPAKVKVSSLCPAYDPTMFENEEAFE